MLKHYKPTDKTAPRFRWSKDRYTPMNDTLHKEYKKTVENPIKDFSVFKAVVEDFSEALKAETVSNRDGVKLPAMMGILGICAFKPKRRQPVNWGVSDQESVRLKEHNLHTAGLACKIVYSCYTAKYKFRNWKLWRFEGNRDFKTKVSQAFIENYRYYKRMDNKSNVSKMFKTDHITQSYYKNDYIGANLQHQGDEQVDQRGLKDNG